MDLVERAAESSSRPHLLTFLIADVRGYTTFTRTRGDAAAAMLAQRFAELSREAVEARSGRVLELRGDEALAVFDSSAQAVRAAIEFQAACREESDADPEFPLPVGIGIDVGQAVAVEGGYRGAALNMAARLCSNAAAGDVLVTERLLEDADLASDGITITARGPTSFKGLAEPVEVMEASGPTKEPVPAPIAMGEPLPRELDPLTPLVDREPEMRWLRGTWRCVKRGSGRMLFVSGPAEIGKTRLAAAFAQHVGDAGGRVRYAGPGGAATALALGAIKEALEDDVPNLLVVDDVDFAGEDVASLLQDAIDRTTTRPTLILGLLRSLDAVPALANLVERADERGDGHRVLPPFTTDHVRDIVRLYVGDDVEDVPLEPIVRSSGGVPGRVHEVASDWARTEASRRLESAAEFLAAGRQQRASDLRFANNVIALKLGRLYVVEGRDDLRGEGLDVCPYKGLASFGEEDSSSFFGRERLVGELAARTVQTGFLGVVGASGSGKSSVVAAGLLPSLQAGLLPGSERWRHASMRPGDRPLEAMRMALAGVAPGVAEAEDPLASALSAGNSERLVLVVDQLEEIFTLCDSEQERSGFFDSLVRAATTVPERIAVVASLRSDFYGHAAPYPEFAALLASNHVLVGPMTRDELRRAIELPARRVGLRVEQAVVDAMVEEVAEEPGGLPLLSTALVELWQAREGGWIRWEAFERTGGVRGAVARLAEASYKQLSESQRQAARRVFLRLVAGDDGDAATRRRVGLEEFDLERDVDARDVITRLARDRLLTVDEGTVEVAHEALLREWPRLQAWLDEDVQGRQLRQQLMHSARQWSSGGREPSELYRGARLSATIDWATTHGEDLNDLEREFLGESRDAAGQELERQRRTNRRLRGLLVGTAVFLVVAIAAGVLALVQRGQARTAATRARHSATVALSQSLAAQAVSEPRLDTAMLLGRAATALDNSPRTSSGLLTTLMRAPTVIRSLHATEFRVNGMALSPDGGRLAVADNSGNVVVSDTGTGQRIGAVTSDSADIALGPDGAVLRTVYRNGRPAVVEAVDPSDDHIGSSFDIPARVGRGPPAEGQPRPGYAYAPRHDRLAVALAVDQERPSPVYIVQWRYSTGKLLAKPLRVPPAPVISIAYVKNERWLTVVGDGTKTFDVSTGHLVRSSAAGGYPAAISSSGDLVATGSEDGSVDFIDLDRGRVQRGKGGHVGAVEALTLTPDGRTLISSGDDGRTLVWDVASRTVRETLTGHSGRVQSQAISSDGRTLYTGGFDTTVLSWDLSGQRSFVRTFQAANTDPGLQAWSLAISPDSQTIAVGETSGVVNLWDAASLRRIARFKAVPGLVAALAFSPDGESLLVAGDDFEASQAFVRLWRLDPEPVLVREMHGGPDQISWAALSPDGKTVAATGWNAGQEFTEGGAVAAWNVSTGRLVARPIRIGGPSGLNGGVPLHVAFSPEGDRVAIAAAGGLAAVLEPGRRKVVTEFSTDAQVTMGVAFSPNGGEVATADFNGFVRFWDAETGEPTRPTIHASDVELNSVAWSPDGSTIATAGGGTLRLYDVDTGRQVGSSFPIPPGTSPYVAFTPDGRAVVATDVTGRAWVWPVALEDWEARACSVANRDLTRTEWSSVAPGRPYRGVCA